MTIEEVKRICDELSFRCNDVFDIPIVINNRLTKTFGRVIYTESPISGYCENKRLEMSGVLLATGIREDIIQVIKHEWAHYYITKKTHANHGHDEVFKSVCAKIGCSHDGARGLVEYTQPMEKIYKYTIYCPNCGCIGGQSRMSNTLKGLKYGWCNCKKCGSTKLTYKQNW